MHLSKIIYYVPFFKNKDLRSPDEDLSRNTIESMHQNSKKGVTEVDWSGVAGCIPTPLSWDKFG